MEDSKMQMKAQAIQLCKMLCKPDSQRMPFQGVQIAKSLQRIPFLSKFFDMKSQPFINLCITSNIIEFPPFTDIYEQQSDRYVYIILEGQVKITLKNHQAEIYEQSKHHLSEFGIFGHTQILFGLEERMERILAEDKTVKCMIFEEDAVKRILSQQTVKFLEKALNFLVVNQNFQHLTLFQKQQLVFYLSLQQFNTKDYLIQPQTQLTQILYLIYGRISIIKQLSLPNSTVQKYKIDELSEMDSFGEFQCWNGKESMYYVIAESSGAYYALDFMTLKESNHRILQTIRQKAVPYPDEEEIGFLHNVKKTLKKEEGKIARKYKLF